MLKDREKLYQAYHTILSMALTWALALAINQYFVLRVPIALSAVLTFAPALLIYLFDTYKKNTITYLIAGSIIPIIGLFFWIRRLNPLVWFRDLTDWVQNYNGSEELYINYHANFMLFVVGVLGAVLFYLLTKKQLAKMILAILIIVTLIILAGNKVNIYKAVIGICIFYLLSILTETYGILYSKRAGKTEKKEAILYLAPICLILAVFSIALPSKPEPIQWTGVKTVYHDIKEQIQVWKTDLDYSLGRSNTEFSVNLTGYSDEGGDLGNGTKLKKDTKVALEISGSYGNQPLYLIGSVSDIYTGRKWEKSHLDALSEEEEYVLDYSELIYALSKQKIEVLETERFVERKTLRIDYNNIKTKTLFYPLKCSLLKSASGKLKFNKKYANITFEKARRKGTSYDTVFYNLNLEGEAFITMLRKAEGFSYGEWDTVNEETLAWIDLNITDHDDVKTILSREDWQEIFKARAEMIQAQYTKLPSTVPERVYDLAHEITAKYDTTYDKLKAIESFLQEYQYTLEPGAIPDNVDFTDYFLFENQKGYCTSYATAMAVLGRCIGVPTRYIEGFIVTYDRRVTDKMYPVMNSQAHAWAEAYIEGVGWIPFEATSPFSKDRYLKWKEIPKQTGTGVAADTSMYNQEAISNRMGLDQIGSVELEEDNASAEILTGFMVFFAAIALLFIVFAIYYLVLGLQYRQKYEKADDSQKMYLLFLRILRLLKGEGYELGAQETILMLAKRVKEEFHYDKITFPIVADIFMQYRYAEAEISEEQFHSVEVFQKGLADKRQAEQSKTWLLWEEFLFLTKTKS